MVQEPLKFKFKLRYGRPYLGPALTVRWAGRHGSGDTWGPLDLDS